MKDSSSRFSAVIDAGSKIGLSATIISFILYLGNLIPSQVPIDRLSSLWVLPLGEFKQAAGIETKPWYWLGGFRFSDGLATISICFLAVLIGIAYAYSAYTFSKERSRTYAIMAVLEVILILAAMAGLV